MSNILAQDAAGLKTERMARVVKDKVILFGTTAIGTYDQRITLILISVPGRSPRRCGTKYCEPVPSPAPVHGPQKLYGAYLVSFMPIIRTSACR